MGREGGPKGLRRAPKQRQGARLATDGEAAGYGLRTKLRRGAGTYKGRLVSPTQIEMAWSGSYETAAAAGQAAA